MIACCVLLSACANTRPPIETAPEVGAKPTADEAKRLALELIVPRLKDPDSIKAFRIEHISARQYYFEHRSAGGWRSGWEVCFSYNAKNSYGAYTGTRRTGFIAKCTEESACTFYSFQNDLDAYTC
jgi:hypothetical protein